MKMFIQIALTHSVLRTREKKRMNKLENSWRKKAESGVKNHVIVQILSKMGKVIKLFAKDTHLSVSIIRKKECPLKIKEMSWLVNLSGAHFIGNQVGGSHAAVMFAHYLLMLIDKICRFAINLHQRAPKVSFLILENRTRKRFNQTIDFKSTQHLTS